MRFNPLAGNIKHTAAHLETYRHMIIHLNRQVKQSINQRSSSGGDSGGAEENHCSCGRILTTVISYAITDLVQSKRYAF